MRDPGFALFVKAVQQDLPDERKLSVFEILTLAKIRDGKKPAELDRRTIEKLFTRKLIEKRGRTKGQTYVLCRSYYEFTGNTADYSMKSDWDFEQVLALVAPYLLKYKTAKMGDFVKLLEGHMTRRQVRLYVQKFIEHNILIPNGIGSGTRYVLSEEYQQRKELLEKALAIGLRALRAGMRPNLVQESPSTTPVPPTHGGV